jgi:cystathionine beta-lyase/cystathionine gamma-synthase
LRTELAIRPGSHVSVPADVRVALDIGENLVRLSVAIEAADDLVADLDRALARM